MRIAGTGLMLVLFALLTGCAASGGGSNTDYDNLPGSGDSMSKGPGLFDGKHYSSSGDGGFLIYSNNPAKKNALVNPNRKQNSKTAAQSAAPSSTAVSSKPPTASQKQEFRQFQDYQQFKKFQRMSKDSPEYQKFREWQDWQQYQQWKNGNSR